MPFYTRKSPRIPGFDYSSQNSYFITICTHEKKCIFGTVRELNTFGKIADEHIRKIGSHYGQVKVDNHKVMPNHIHLILTLESGNRADAERIIGLYKSGVTRIIHEIDPKCKVWQRSFHDHVIRNDREYQEIWQYIQYNEQKWEADCFYPNGCEL